MKKILLALLIIVSILLLISARLHNERYYQDKWCLEQGGQVEVRLPDRTRCDCLTENNAIEFDFGSKWAEAIGQALYYSTQTGKRAGIVLILEKDSDRKYWFRMMKVIQTYQLPIDVWRMGPE